MNKVTVCLFALLFLYVASCKKDSTCTTSDTTQTFAAKIKPIMDNSCNSVGCHNSASASGGVVLDTYDGTVAAVKNKNLISAVSPGGSMPQGSNPLPDSLINKIIAWKNNCYQR
jgi:hypothetical protein